MHSADKKLSELHNNISGLPEDSLQKNIGENTNKEILTCFFRDFETEYHKGELNISLFPGQERLDKNNINSWEMSFRYKKDPNYRVSIIYSILNNTFLVYKNGGIYYSSNAKKLWLAYPRALDETNANIEQAKFNKMIKQWANIMVKILNHYDQNGKY